MSLQCKSYIKEQIITIKNIPTIAEKTFYAAIVLRGTTISGIFYLPKGSAAFTSLYNKANEIIIKHNDKNAAQALNSQFRKDIVESINQYIKTKNIKDIDV